MLWWSGTWQAVMTTWKAWWLLMKCALYWWCQQLFDWYIELQCVYAADPILTPDMQATVIGYILYREVGGLQTTSLVKPCKTHAWAASVRNAPAHHGRKLCHVSDWADETKEQVWVTSSREMRSGFKIQGSYRSSAPLKETEDPQKA